MREAVYNDAFPVKRFLAQGLSAAYTYKSLSSFAYPVSVQLVGNSTEAAELGGRA